MSDPIITRLERQKKNSRRVSIYLDEVFAFGIEEDVAFQYQLVKGKSVPPELAAILQEHSARIEARRIAERLISRRMRSEKEIRTRLARDEVPSRAIDAVVSDLKRIALIDDAAFAEAYVTDRQNLKPRARLLLLRELMTKGVERKLAAEVLDRMTSPESEIASAAMLLRKYLARQTSAASEVIRRRAFAYLQRRGYAADIIARILRAEGNDDLADARSGSSEAGFLSDDSV